MSIKLMRLPESAVERFMSLLEGGKREGVECWEWPLSLNNKGYGQFQTGKGMVLAHRASWFIHHGEIPDGMCILHRCDNRRCCRPDHLFVGTKADNNADMRSKGRHSTKEANAATRGRSKLSAEQIALLKQQALSGTPKRRLAKSFGISASHVARLIEGKTHASANV